MIGAISGSDHGQYYIHTAHSVYRLDLDVGTLARFPLAADAADMRGDCQPVALQRIVQCVVGLPGAFIVEGLVDDDTETVRVTTQVERIEVVA